MQARQSAHSNVRPYKEFEPIRLRSACSIDDESIGRQASVIRCDTWLWRAASNVLGAESPLMTQVLFHPMAGHGGFILDTRWRHRILQQIQTVIDAGAEAACRQQSAF